MEKVVELWVRLQSRLSEERGQTAAEYMGLMFVIAVIIFALAQSGIGGDIAGEAKDLIKDIGGGGKEAPK